MRIAGFASGNWSLVRPQTAFASPSRSWDRLLNIRLAHAKNHNTAAALLPVLSDVWGDASPGQGATGEGALISIMPYGGCVEGTIRFGFEHTKLQQSLHPWPFLPKTNCLLQRLQSTTTS